MNLEVAATYLPDADEVYVDFRSTQDDLVTLSIADRVTVNLLVSSMDLNGTTTYRPLASILATSDYLQAEKNYLLKFRHPQRKQDLFIGVEATYGVTTFQKQVQVGIADPSFDQMELPDNVLFERDPFDISLDQGDNKEDGSYTPNPNQVILDQKILDYAQKFDFTLALDPEEYDPLIYTGGGNRLLMNNKNQSFEAQLLDQAPWSLSAYAFMEPGVQNLLPNPYFNVSANGIPTGYTVDGVGSILNQTVAPNYQTATGAQLWTLRFRQTNVYSAFTQAKINLTAPVSVSGSTSYCFSSYLKVTPLSQATKVTELTLLLKWKDSLGVLISTSQVNLMPSDFSTLSLASYTAISPPSTAQVEPEIQLGSIDAGDDVQLVLFAPQLEAGVTPTSRTEGTRVEDVIEIPTYNALNQKVHLEFIPGFAAGTARALTTGPLLLSLTATGTFKANIPDAGVSLETTPLSFVAGDSLDFTIQHLAGGAFKLYQSGVVVAQTTLPAFTSSPAPLLIHGFLGELLRLTVFSRK